MFASIASSVPPAERQTRRSPPPVPMVQPLTRPSPAPTSDCRRARDDAVPGDDALAALVPGSGACAGRGRGGGYGIAMQAAVDDIANCLARLGQAARRGRIAAGAGGDRQRGGGGVAGGDEEA